MLLFVMASLLVAAITLFLVPKQYHSSSLLVSANPSLADKSHMLNQNIQGLYSIFGSGDDLERIYGIASMDTVFKQLVDEFDLVTYYKLKSEDPNRLRRKAVLDLRDDLSIQKTELSQLKITVFTKDAELSAKIVNRIVDITRTKEESIWKSGNEKMLLNFNKSIDSLGKVYQAIANKIKSDNENLSQLELTKINSLLEQIHTQEKAAGEIKLAIDNNAPAFYVLETAVPAAKSEKPNIPEVLILTALISWLFCAMALLIYNREDSL
ncbi:MAG: hypothetical protein WCH78_04175 [Bacteroidota bacterium]